MKYLLLFLVAFSLVSCNEETEEIYSCNPTINKSIVENLSTFRNMSRAQWLRLSEDLKIPAYRTFSPEARFRFWKEKFAEVKKLNWTSAELQHIKSAENFLYSHPDIVSTKEISDELRNKRDLFFYEWMQTATNKLGWSKSTALSIVASGNKVVNTKGYIEIINKKKTLNLARNINNYIDLSDSLSNDTTDFTINPTDSMTIDNDTSSIVQFNCHCHKGNVIDFCPLGTYCDNTIISCVESSSGCGWLINESCNGVCF